MLVKRGSLYRRSSFGPTQTKTASDNTCAGAVRNHLDATVLLRDLTRAEETARARKAWSVEENGLLDNKQGVKWSFTHLFTGHNLVDDCWKEVLLPHVLDLLGTSTPIATFPSTLKHVRMAGPSGAGKTTLLRGIIERLCEVLFDTRLTQRNCHVYLRIVENEDKKYRDLGHRVAGLVPCVKGCLQCSSFSAHSWTSMTFDLPEAKITAVHVASPELMTDYLSRALIIRATEPNEAHHQSSRSHLHILVDVFIGGARPPFPEATPTPSKLEELGFNKRTLILSDAIGIEEPNVGKKSKGNTDASHLKGYFEQVDHALLRGTEKNADLAKLMRAAARNSPYTEFIHSTLVQNGTLVNILCLGPADRDYKRAIECLRNGTGVGSVPLESLAPGSYLQSGTRPLPVPNHSLRRSTSLSGHASVASRATTPSVQSRRPSSSTMPLSKQSHLDSSNGRTVFELRSMIAALEAQNAELQAMLAVNGRELDYYKGLSAELRASRDEKEAYIQELIVQDRSLGYSSPSGSFSTSTPAQATGGSSVEIGLRSNSSFIRQIPRALRR